MSDIAVLILYFGLFRLFGEMTEFMSMLREREGEREKERERDICR